MNGSLDRRTILKALAGAAGAPLLPAAPSWAQAPEHSAAIAASLRVPMPLANIRAAMADSAAAYLGNWAGLPEARLESSVPLSIGASGPDVVTLRKRLGLRDGETFDTELGNAVAAFRSAHGLPFGTDVDSGLVEVLNGGPSAYAEKVKANLARINRLPEKLADRFALVDSASQMLFMVENGSLVDSMRVIVGKPSDPTPLLGDSIRFVVLNPYWYVPPDLVRDRYAPRVLAQGKSYLTTRGFEALADWSDAPKPVTYEEVDWQAVAAGKIELPFRQKPGPGNGMGKIKFMFPNPHGVYLHDTPSVELFQKPVRTFSAGCVRVHRPWALATWLFDGQLPPPTSEIEKIVQLPRPVPLYLAYLTAVPHAAGFTFLDDIYGWDKNGTGQG